MICNHYIYFSYCATEKLRTRIRQKKDSESQRCLHACIWSTCSVQRPLIRSTGSLSVCRLSVGASRTILYSLDYAPNQITCLFIHSVLRRQKSSSASFILHVFLWGLPNNIHNKPSGLCFQRQAAGFEFIFLVGLQIHIHCNMFKLFSACFRNPLMFRSSNWFVWSRWHHNHPTSGRSWLTFSALLYLRYWSVAFLNALAESLWILHYNNIVSVCA